MDKGPGTMSSLSVFELKGRGEKISSSSTPSSSPCQGSLSSHGLSIGIGGTNPDSTTNQTSKSSGPTNMYSLKWNTQLLALQRSLANLWDNGIGTDAVLLCQGTPLPVHKIILTAASPYVASVVQTMVTAAHMMPVIVVDIPSEAGKALLSFLYCGEAHVPVSVIPHLVAGAKFLGISGFGEPGVLESLTGMVPESVGQTTTQTSPSPSSGQSDKPLRSTDSPHKLSENREESGIPTMQLPLIPSIHGVHVSSAPSPTPSVQSSHSTYSYHSGRGGRGESRSGERSKSSSPFPPPPAFLESLKLSRVSPGNNKSNKDSSPQKNSSGRLFIGGTSILDNLLKNPRNQTPQPTTPYNEGPVNLSCNNNSEDVEGDQESEGSYADTLYFSPSHASGHFILQDTQAAEDGENEHDDGGPIPAQLLEPNVEYHIGNEFSRERYSGSGRGGSHIGLPLSIQNPLIDLAKVASAMHSHQQQIQQYQQQIHRQHLPLSEPSTTRGVKRKPRNTTQDSDLISSSRLDPSLQTTKPLKPKKPQEAIICDICNKKFSNAYNLRVHMEGHSGQVFVCSVCSHASRSRDALRKHFAYRHRELWVRGMSAFRKGSGGLPNRKLSVSKSNNSPDNIKMEEDEPNNNSLVDANGNISLNVRGGSDGTLTISEAFPPPGLKTEV